MQKFKLGDRIEFESKGKLLRGSIIGQECSTNDRRAIDECLIVKPDGDGFRECVWVPFYSPSIRLEKQ